MTEVTISTTGFCAPSAGRSQWRTTGLSLVGAVAYPLSAPGTGVAKHSQKRFAMARDINGWPLAPRDGTSG